ncbi:MAG TPA: NADH-quinone oxidoreductase subunit L [Pseudomonadota bacterium]|nr:NADH-quinone oxidoreductase subunit L [Pseudomonadota bacterium]
MFHSAYSLALIALLLPGAVALLLATVPALRHRVTAIVFSVLAALTSLGSAILLVLGQLTPTPPQLWTVPWLPQAGAPLAEIGLRIDGISASMLLVVTFVASCVQIFSIGYMHDESKEAQGRYFTYHSLFLTAMNILVLAPNLLQLFLGWELVGVTSYLLIGYYFKKPSAAKAAVKAFWVTKFADMGLLIGLLVLRSKAGSFDWDVQIAPSAANLVTLLLFVAVMGKSAQFPLHVWLPDAMEGPTPVSALLHAATMVAAGVFLIVRGWPLFELAQGTRQIMLAVGSVTALIAATMALFQNDIKKVLAYSTCSQLGYMIAALGAGSLLGGFFHLTTHAFFKALLFLGAGSVIHAVHSNDMRDMGGLARKMPLTTVTFLIGSLSLMGLPGLSGFFSKDLIIEAVGERGVSWQLVFLLISAFLTAFYMGRLLVRVFFAQATEKASHAHESSAVLILPLLLLAVPALAAGYLGKMFGQLYGSAYHFHLGTTGIIAAGLGLLGLGLAYLLYRRSDEHPALLAPIARLVEYGPMDRLYAGGFHRVALPFAALIGWIDRYLIDGIMNLTGLAFVVSGQKIRRVQTGIATDYVLATVCGVLLLVLYGVLR